MQNFRDRSTNKTTHVTLAFLNLPYMFSFFIRSPENQILFYFFIIVGCTVLLYLIFIIHLPVEEHLTYILLLVIVTRERKNFVEQISIRKSLVLCLYARNSIVRSYDKSTFNFLKFCLLISIVADPILNSFTRVLFHLYYISKLLFPTF